MTFVYMVMAESREGHTVASLSQIRQRPPLSGNASDLYPTQLRCWVKSAVSSRMSAPISATGFAERDARVTQGTVRSIVRLHGAFAVLSAAIAPSSQPSPEGREGVAGAFFPTEGSLRHRPLKEDPAWHLGVGHIPASISPAW